MPLTSGGLLVYLPSPQTYALNQQVKAPLLRADVGDTVQVLTNPPFFSGAQTVNPTSIPNSGAATQIALDTENADPYNGHLVSVNPSRYYGMFPGWYLAIASVPSANQSGGGVFTSYVGLSQGGGAPVYISGMYVPTAGTPGNNQCISAKLIQFTSTGNYGGSANDYAVAAASQTSTNATISTRITINQYPTLQLRWCGTGASTAGLIVPTNDTWPSPPSYVTSAFLNKNSRDACDFLLGPPVMEAYDSGTAQTLGSQAAVPVTGTTIKCDAVTVDNSGAFSTGAFTWTAPYGGLYYCYGQLGLTMSANALGLAAGLTITSGNYNGGTKFTMWGGSQQAFSAGGFLSAAIVQKRLRLAAGDTVSLAGWQATSGGAGAAVQQTYATRLICCWLAA